MVESRKYDGQMWTCPSTGLREHRHTEGQIGLTFELVLSLEGRSLSGGPPFLFIFMKDSFLPVVRGTERLSCWSSTRRRRCVVFRTADPLAW